MFRFYDFKKILSLICTATGFSGKVNLLLVIETSYLSRRSLLRTLKVKRSTNPTAAV